MRRLHRTVLAGVLIATAAACGRKGPPLPPEHIEPAAVAGLGARVVDGRVELHFTLPTRNTNGTTPAALTRVDVFAVSLAAGEKAPRNEMVAVAKNLVGHVDVKPPDAEEPADANKPPDARPAQGDVATFLETLPAPPTAAAAPLKVRPAPPVAAPSTPPPASSSTAPVAGSSTAPLTASSSTPPTLADAKARPSRLYAVAGVANGRRTGPLSTVAVPFAAAPDPPSDAAITSNETTLTLVWKGPADGAFRVYAVDRSGKERPGGAKTVAPVKALTFDQPVQFGVETCLAVRAVVTEGSVAIESAATTPVCETPIDTYPPPTPTGLNAVPDVGVVQLAWNAVTASDLAGYIVLRREAGTANMQRLTTELVRGTTWNDSTARPGVTYEYAVRSVDKATPPNESPDSEKKTVTARVPHASHEGD